MSRKIFFLCASLQSGGAERVLSVLSKPLADHYDMVEYLMWYEKPIFYKIDPRVHLLSIEKECGSKNKIKKTLWFRHYILANKPNLLIPFAVPFNILALSVLMDKKTPIIAAERIDPNVLRRTRGPKTLRNWLYRRAKGILVQTKSSRAYFRGSSLYKKTCIIPNPIFMEPDYVGSALKMPKQPLFVTAARLSQHKRHDLIIETFAEFRKKYPEYKLKIYGEGKEREKLNLLINQLGQSESITLEGNTKTLWDYMKPATAFVITSLYEGMSNSLIEAMCLGLPCISTKVSGAIDLINDGKNGFLIDINDRKALLDCMIKIVENHSLANKIALESSKLYDKLNVEKVSALWIDYIDKMMEA